MQLDEKGARQFLSVKDSFSLRQTKSITSISYVYKDMPCVDLSFKQTPSSCLRPEDNSKN